MDFESENIEFKTDFVDDLWKEVAAFANTSGGRIIIGKNDKGETIGLDNIDSTYTKITDSVRDSILPDVTMFVKYTLTDEGTIMIDVSEGSVKPYYNKSKGLKPSGVYVRQGASSVPASVDLLQRNIRTTDNSTNSITAALAAVFVLSEASTLPFRTKGMSHTLIHYLCSTH